MSQPHMEGFEIPTEQPPVGTRRGWSSCGTEITAVPDAAYPPDPAVVRWMRLEFDPELMPLFVRRAYRNAKGTIVVAGFHAIATARWNPSSAPHPWTEQVFQTASGRLWKPTGMVMHLEDRKARLGDGLPGNFLSFNERVYGALRSLYQEWTDREKLAFIDENDSAARARKARERAEAEAEYRVRHDAAWLERRLANITREDAYDAAAKLREKKIQVTVPGDGAIEAALS